MIEKLTELVTEYDGTKFVKPYGITKTVKDIAIGVGGSLFVVDKAGSQLNRWNATNKSFDKVNNSNLSTHVAVESDGRLWLLNINNSGSAFRAK